MAYNTEEEKKLATTVDEQLAQKPADFAWDKQQLLDDTTDKWLNREDFQYDYTNDPLYQQYKEQYTNLGKLAMQDTMGQAAALTGGYGNSYAQTAGQQAYQGYLQQLNNVMPELYGAAYDRYMAEGQALYDQIALLEGQRSQAYGEHQDQYSQWQNYLNFLYQQERDAVTDSQWQQEYNLSAAKAYGGGGDGTSDIPAYITDRLEQGFNSDEEKMAYLVGQAQTGAITSTQMGQLSAAYSFAGDEATTGSEEDGFVKANFMRVNGDGNYVFEMGGEEHEFAPGVNPYTSTKNSDVKYGTFSNGYQPNNVNGEKLSKTGDVVYVHGIAQNVWQTKDGTRYVWDGEENRYINESEIEYGY